MPWRRRLQRTIFSSDCMDQDTTRLHAVQCSYIHHRAAEKESLRLFLCVLALSAQYAKKSLCNGTVSVRLSVPFARRCCGCAVVGPANGRYRSIAARRSAANAGSATLSAGVGN